MKRDQMLQELEQQRTEWDIIIIGGGATGLGAAVDASSRGYRTLLLEQADFAKGTSSRSTKLIHGGLRYLQQGNVGLVVEALKERGILCKNAPHLIHHLPFLLPLYRFWERPFYSIGLKLYDLLAGKLAIESSKHLSKEKALKEVPTLNPDNLRGAMIYYDGQFDDSRLAITLAKTAAEQGGVLINYMKVTGLIHEDGQVSGVKAQDQETKQTHKIYAKVVINACGIFVDDIRQMNHAKEKHMIAPSQGIHIVLPKSFQPGNKAVLIPSTEDGRVIFMVPWHDHVLIGTTDTPVNKTALEPMYLNEEVDFLLKHANHYLTSMPSRKDVLSVFAGLRPLIKTGKSKLTAALSRDHSIWTDKSGLITIAGGKWTTYRKMAEDVIQKAIKVGCLEMRKSVTHKLKLHGWDNKMDPTETFSVYGSELKKLKSLMKQDKALAEPLHPDLPYVGAQVVWAVREEMARSIEDVLARRTRALFLNSRASLEMAPKVASIMAEELGMDQNWQDEQLESYRKVAKKYVCSR